MKNHWAANHVTRNFSNSHVKLHLDEKPFGCTQYLCDKDAEMLFQKFEKWKVFLWSSQMVIHLTLYLKLGVCKNFLSHEWHSNGFSYECILTQEFGKFLVTWVAAKKFLIRVYFDVFIQTWEFVNSLKYTDIKKPFSCYSCDKKFIKPKVKTQRSKGVHRHHYCGVWALQDEVSSGPLGSLGAKNHKGLSRVDPEVKRGP